MERSENGRYHKMKVGGDFIPSGTEVKTDQGLGVVMTNLSVLDKEGKPSTVALQIHGIEDGINGKFISAENRWIVEKNETVRLTGIIREIPDFFWWRLRRRP